MSVSHRKPHRSFFQGDIIVQQFYISILVQMLKDQRYAFSAPALHIFRCLASQNAVCSKKDGNVFQCILPFKESGCKQKYLIPP